MNCNVPVNKEQTSGIECPQVVKSRAENKASGCLSIKPLLTAFKDELLGGARSGLYIRKIIIRKKNCHF